MKACAQCGRLDTRDRLIRFSTDDASQIIGVPDGPLRLWFCSREHLADWQSEHPRRWPEPDAWPDITRERPARTRLAIAAAYVVVAVLAVVGAVSVVQWLVQSR